MRDPIVGSQGMGTVLFTKRKLADALPFFKSVKTKEPVVFFSDTEDSVWWYMVMLEFQTFFREFHYKEHGSRVRMWLISFLVFWGMGQGVLVKIAFRVKAGLY